MGVGVWAATWVSQGTKCDSWRGALGGPRQERRVLTGSLHRGQQLAIPFLGQMAWALLGPPTPGLAYHVPSCPGPLSYPSALLP